MSVGRKRWHRTTNERSSKRTRTLALELLDRRAMLTTFFVDGAAADGGTGAVDDPFDTIGEALVAAAASPGADTVSLAPGTYEEALSIEDPDSLTLEGNGATVDGTGFGTHGIEIDDSGHITIRNLTVSGDRDGINADGLQSLNLDNVTATGCGDEGIQAEDMQSLTLNNVSVIGNSDHGVSTEDIGTVKVTGGDYVSNGGDGLQLTDTASVSISGGVFSENDGGIDIESDDDAIGAVTIRDVTAERNGDEGLEVDGVHFVQVLGGRFHENIEAGLDIDDSFQIHLLGVTATDNGEHGLQITAGDDGLEGSVIHNVLVVDSVFDGNTGDGINVRSDAANSFVQLVRLVRVTASNNTESGLDIIANDVHLALVTSGVGAGNTDDDHLP